MGLQAGNRGPDGVHGRLLTLRNSQSKAKPHCGQRIEGAGPFRDNLDVANVSRLLNDLAKLLASLELAVPLLEHERAPSSNSATMLAARAAAVA